MTYFVTGATGFIGRHLLQKLLLRKGTIYCLVRKESLAKFKELCERLGADKDRVVAIVGDLAKPRLGVAPQTGTRDQRTRSSTSSISPRCTTSPPTPKARSWRTSKARATRSRSPTRSRPAYSIT